MNGGPEALAQLRDDALKAAYQGLEEKKEAFGKIPRRRGRPQRGMGVRHRRAYRIYRGIEADAYRMEKKWRNKLDRAINDWRCPACKYDENSSYSYTCTDCGYDRRN